MGTAMTRLRIATRESRLAMRQTEMVSAAIRERHPGIAVEIVGMTTRGDRVLDRPLAQVG
ncbi:MAG TPA: hydroxymethylbilane synthase, partial [Usitatibacter sp.]